MKGMGRNSGDILNASSANNSPRHQSGVTGDEDRKVIAKVCCPFSPQKSSFFLFA